MPKLEYQNEILSAKFPASVSATVKAYAESIGVTAYEVIQLIGFKIAEYARYKQGMQDELAARTADILESFGIDHDVLFEHDGRYITMTDTLKSYRRLTGMQSVKDQDGDIEYVVTLHRGGVVAVYDPRDTSDGHLSGSVTISREKAIELLLMHDKQLNADVHKVMQDRGLSSPLQAIRDVMSCEVALIDRQEHEQTNYASNEYGNVPVQKRNKSYEP